MFGLNEEITPEKRNKIITQITAKASWGDSKEETLKYARLEGLTNEEVDFHVNHAYLKRENFVRKAGTSYLIVAAAMIVISIILAVIIGALPSGILSKLLCIPMIYLISIGLYKLLKGVLLITVGDKHTCLTELEGARDLPGIMRL